MTLMLTYADETFIGRCDFDSRHIFQGAGFRWDKGSKVWYTRELRVATRLRAFADSRALKELNRHLLSYSPWASRIPYPPHLTPYPFQIEKAVPFILARNRCYAGMAPGTGKTICAIMALNALFEAGEIDCALYVCPPFLMANVESEFEKWATFDYRMSRYSNDVRRKEFYHANVVIMPDSLLSADKRTKAIDGRLRTFTHNWLTVSRGALIVDEAHRFKNEESQRSIALYEGLLPHFERAVFMSGTPMPNRPMELFAVLHHAAPEIIDFRNKFEYGRYYCAGYKTQFGWDFTGASHQAELIPVIKEKFLLRIKKEDVLKDLPPKTEAVVFLSADYPAKLAALEKQILSQHSPQDVLKSALDSPHVATYRRMLGEIKTPKALEFIRGVLEDSDESLLVFAHHKDVVSALEEGLTKYKPLVIAGHVGSDERFRRAKLFQQDSRYRVLISNIQAGGVGFNLTKATRVIFVEYSWVPAENEQAIDRAHRIGQKGNVFAMYLVYRNSLDAKILHEVLHKQKVTGRL